LGTDRRAKADETGSIEADHGKDFIQITRRDSLRGNYKKEIAVVHGLETLKRLNDQASASSDLSACLGAEAQLADAVPPRLGDGQIETFSGHLYRLLVEHDYLEVSGNVGEMIVTIRRKETQPESHDG
jgi:tyrosine-protein phosphatase YwqE